MENILKNKRSFQAIFFISLILLVSILTILPRISNAVVCTENIVEGQNSEYCLLAPLPGFEDGKIDTIKMGLGGYINIMFRFVIGLIGLMAVVMIVIGGIEYMSTEAIFKKGEAKNRIMGALGGLLLVLFSFVLLNTLNPNLTDIGIIRACTFDDWVAGGAVEDNVLVPAKIPDAAKKMRCLFTQVAGSEFWIPNFDHISSISAADFKQLTGKEVLNPGEYKAKGRQVAQEVGIPICVMDVLITRETRGNPTKIVGCDENTASDGVPSRVAFINSQIKYSEVPFVKNQGQGKDLASITNGKFQNDCVIDKGVDDLGVDWRFSKGIGILQITFFPPTYFSEKIPYSSNPPPIETKKDVPKQQQITGVGKFDPKDLIDPDLNLNVGAKLWKYYYEECLSENYTGDNAIRGAFSRYATGNKCNPTTAYAIAEVDIRMSLYKQCEANPNY